MKTLSLDDFLNECATGNAPTGYEDKLIAIIRELIRQRDWCYCFGETAPAETLDAYDKDLLKIIHGETEGAES